MKNKVTDQDATHLCVMHVHEYLILLTPSDQVALKSTDKVSTDLDIQNQTFPEGRG